MQEKIARMEKIGKELSKIESFSKSGQLSGEINMEDAASIGLKMFSQVSGAQFGRWVAAKTGGGTVQTPGIFSKRFQQFTNFMGKDKAHQMVYDAVLSKDPKLLEALLLPIDKPQTRAGQENLNTLINRLNLWSESTGKRVLDENLREEPTNTTELQQTTPSATQGYQIQTANPEAPVTHIFTPGQGIKLK